MVKKPHDISELLDISVDELQFLILHTSNEIPFCNCEQKFP
jgi:hypothetical protein